MTNADLRNSLDAIATQLGDLRQAVGRIEGQARIFIDQMKVQDERVTKLDARQTKIEGQQRWFAGFGAGVGAILGAAVSSVLHRP